jgi:hypothetical protein
MPIDNMKKWYITGPQYRPHHHTSTQPYTQRPQKRTLTTVTNIHLIPRRIDQHILRWQTRVSALGQRANRPSTRTRHDAGPEGLVRGFGRCCLSLPWLGGREGVRALMVCGSYLLSCHDVEAYGRFISHIRSSSMMCPNDAFGLRRINYTFFMQRVFAIRHNSCPPQRATTV